MKKFLVTFILVVVLILTGVILVKYYSYIFARNVHGVIVKVEKPTAPVAVVGTGEESSKMAEKQLFSFAVAIKVKDGEIVTASTEDRQWSVAEVGLCVEAKFYPYAPWNFDKAGTYYNARLLKMYECNTMEPKQ